MRTIRVSDLACHLTVQALKGAGYDINYLPIDLRTLLGFLACIVACVAQFWPGKEKNSAIVIAPCVSGYVLLSLIVWGMQSMFQRDTIAWTKEHPGMPIIVLKSKLPRYGEEYTLSAVMKGRSISESRKSSTTQSIGLLFSEDAQVQTDAITGMVNDLLHQLDAPSESSNGNKKEM